MWNKRLVREGERFIKANGFDRDVWVVAELMERPGVPRHVRLAKEGHRGEMMTISAATLADSRVFRAVTAPA